MYGGPDVEHFRMMVLEILVVNRKIVSFGGGFGSIGCRGLWEDTPEAGGGGWRRLGKGERGGMSTQHRPRQPAFNNRKTRRRCWGLIVY